MLTPENHTTTQTIPSDPVHYALSGVDLRKQWIPWQPPATRPAALPNPKILGQVRDVHGALWDIRQIRPTKHGFDLLYGSPDSATGIYRGGAPRIIATQPLVDFWQANRARRDGIMFDLPAGRTTLKRLRARLGFNWVDDSSEFWQDRIEDLATLSPRAFAERHHINAAVASDARRKLLGRFARELNWWNKRRPLRILRSNLTLRAKGKLLGISTSQVHRLSRRAIASNEKKGH